MAAIETVERETRTICGKTYDVTITRREGLDSYIDLAIDPSGTPFLADAATFIDYGPKMGVTKCYTMHKEVQPTEEERAAGRRHIQEVAVKCLIDQGIW